jgi:hypothetical protein
MERIVASGTRIIQHFRALSTAANARLKPEVENRFSCKQMDAQEPAK